jgi:hypothetical protein
MNLLTNYTAENKVNKNANWRGQINVSDFLLL